MINLFLFIRWYVLFSWHRVKAEYLLIKCLILFWYIFYARDQKFIAFNKYFISKFNWITQRVTHFIKNISILLFVIIFFSIMGLWCPTSLRLLILVLFNISLEQVYLYQQKKDWTSDSKKQQSKQLCWKCVKWLSVLYHCFSKSQSLLLIGKTWVFRFPKKMLVLTF